MDQAPVNCQVHVIEPTADRLDTQLGITKERLGVLKKVMAEAVASGKDRVQAAELYSRTCLHPNELFFLAYMHGGWEQHNNSGMALLAAILQPK